LFKGVKGVASQGRRVAGGKGGGGVAIDLEKRVMGGESQSPVGGIALKHLSERPGYERGG